MYIRCVIAIEMVTMQLAGDDEEKRQINLLAEEILGAASSQINASCRAQLLQKQRRGVKGV